MALLVGNLDPKGAQVWLTIVTCRSQTLGFKLWVSNFGSPALTLKLSNVEQNVNAKVCN